MKKTAQINIRVAPDVDAMFKELCHLDNRSRTHEIEYLIVERLRKIKQNSKEDANGNGILKLKKQQPEYKIDGQ